MTIFVVTNPSTFYSKKVPKGSVFNENGYINIMYQKLTNLLRKFNSNRW